MIDRIDATAGAVSTLAHLALAVAAWIAAWQAPPDPEPADPGPGEREVVAAPQRLPPSERAPVVLPAEAAVAEERPEPSQRTELPPLDPGVIDFTPRPQPLGERASRAGAGDDADAGLTVELPPASELARRHRRDRETGRDTAEDLDREERMLAEAKHVFAGWLRRAWVERWRARFGDRLRNRDLILMVTVDGSHRVMHVRFVEGHGTGIAELDSLIMLHIEERGRQGRAWGLPPLPNRERASYPFPVRLPR